MFTVTQNSGFKLTFENQWTASVQFGPCTYSSNYDDNDFDAPKQISALTLGWESTTAEIAAGYKDNRGTSTWYKFGDDLGDCQVKGWCTANDVVDFLAMVSKLPSRKLTKADYKKGGWHEA